MKTWIAVALFSGMAFAQNVQTPPSNAPSTTPAPIFAANSKYLQGVGLGYWPTAGTGLTLNLAAGHARCGNTMVNYAAGTVALTDNATNYVGLNTASSCVPVVNTSGYTSTMISVATVTTSSGAITTLFDDRILGMTNPGTSGGTGCILPGYDTAVITEHPIGTCYGNADFTWDDTNFRGSWGWANSLPNYGNYQHLIGYGIGLTQTAATLSPVLQQIYAIGDGAGITNADDSTMHDVFVMGDGPGVQTVGHNAKIIGATLISNGGGFSVTGMPSPSATATTLQNVYVLGDGALDPTLGGSVQDAYFLGSNTSTPSGTGNAVSDLFGVGYNDFNSTDGTAHSFMGGLGVNELYNCNSCYAIGEVEITSSNTIGLGVSSHGDFFPTLTVGTGNVQRIPTGMSSHQIDHARTSGFGTIVGTKGQTCVVNITGGAVGVATLNGTNSLPSGSNITITSTAYYAVAPTDATLANGTATCSGSINLQTVLLRDPIPACSAETEGSMAAIVDSTTNTWGATISGGGTDHVMGYCDGTAWTVMAK